MARKVDVKALVSHILIGDGEDKCRICMGDTTDGQVFLEDTVMEIEDRSVTLAEVLETITGVEMNVEGLCPPSVCRSCTESVVLANEFRQLVSRSASLWAGATAAFTALPEESARAVHSACAVFDPTLDTLQVVADVGTSPRQVVRTLRERTRNNVIPKRQKHTRVGPSCRCPDCDKEFLSPYYLNVHLRNSNQKEACYVCGEVIIRGRPLMEHLQAVHGEKAILCEECPLVFTNPELFARHVKATHRAGARCCRECGRAFPRRASYELHAQMHVVRTCRACERQFANRACYREHRARCEPDAKPPASSMPRSRRSNNRDPATYICDFCQKTYHSRPQLKNHIKWIHMDVRPHQCQWCSKRFYTPTRLAEHTVVHTRERRFGCDLCGARLVSRMAAVYHRRRHTGEKPHKCETCGERFISHSRKVEHAKRRHNVGPKVPCLQCSATFARRFDLRKHMERAHTDKGPKVGRDYTPVEA